MRISYLSESVYPDLTYILYVQYISLHKLNHQTEFRTLDSSLIVTIVGFGTEQLEYQENFSNHVKYHILAFTILYFNQTISCVFFFLSHLVSFLRG